MAISNRGAGPAGLARALYLPGDPTKDEGLTMSEAQSITDTLDLEATIAVRDQTISALQGHNAELQSSLTAAHDAAQRAMQRVTELEAAMAAKSAEMALLIVQMEKAGAVSDLSGPKVRLIAPHGYIDVNGHNHFWAQGEVVSDQTVIASLKARGAPVQDI